VPELPDLTVYIEALDERLTGATLDAVRLRSPFLLRTAVPPVTDAEGREIVGFRRIGKQLVIELSGELFLIIHLMIAGRLQYKPRAPAPIPRGKAGLAAFDTSAGTLLLTEASPKKRASLHVVAGADGLLMHDPGGIEPLAADLAGLRAALTRENHTIKRALTDGRLIAGIGNAYSDEILHRARLSPFVWTARLTDAQWAGLHAATQAVLSEATATIRAGFAGKWPNKVTAFRPEMAVHGKFGEPCPVCDAPIQRITYAEKNDMNYCPGCQTGGKILADRSLSKLMKDDWPRTLDDLEKIRPTQR
jgi:formamidopyrimidine-DNA glycosylase